MRRTTMRRSLSALALVATASFVLAACGGGNNNSSAGGKSPGEGKAECARGAEIMPQPCAAPWRRG